jgi:energy-coupling factor transporter ATP-binding protein EcfA2
VSSLDRLASHRLVVVTGKGGVGKTTLTAVLGSLLAARGKRVLLLEVDPRESLHQVLGTEPSGGRIVAAGLGLAIQNLQPAAVIEDLVREKVPLAYLARKITESPAFRQFVDGAPGLKETALLGYAYRALHGGRTSRWDLVLVDAPATGHSATMMAAPGLLAQAAQGGQLGAMAAELASFLADAAQCGVVLTTLAEEMPVQETLELLALLRTRHGIRPGLVVANALYPSPDAGGLPPRGGQDPATEFLRARRRLNEEELTRLWAAWDGPRVELPMLPLDRGPALVAALAARFAEVDR